MNTNYFFTSDEHFGHFNVIRYNNRPFKTLEEMDETLIQNFNSKVSNSDSNVTIHCGDFTFAKTYEEAHRKYISRLNGKHVFLMGSHDYWLKQARGIHEVWERKIQGQWVVACHYAMRVWARSHYGSWHVYGHSHGNLPSFGKSYDVGVDNNALFPLSFEELSGIMSLLDENFNLVRK